MFRVCLVPLTSFFPLGLSFVHRGFAVRGSFQERNTRERRGCAALYAVKYSIQKMAAKSERTQA
jgi:hypothetical protein